MHITESGNKMKTTEQLKQVIEFMKVGAQPVNTEFHFQSAKVADFRLALIEEELYGKKELLPSLQNDNLEGLLDGICDVLYVAYGAIATYGSFLPEVDIPERGEGLTGVVLAKHIALSEVGQIINGLDQFRRGTETGDSMAIQRGLGYVVSGAISLATASQLDLIGAFDEVHKSNMSKFCKSRESAEFDIKTRMQDESKKEDYTGAYVEEVNVDEKLYYVIKRAADGKVLKGLDFFEPDLTKYI